MPTAFARTLVVESSPPLAVPVAADPPDTSGTSQGATHFSLTYPDAAEVTVTAPNAVGRYRFQKWLKDGLPFETGLKATITMDGDHVLKAIYVEVAASFPAGLRIMPLGDSITYGFNGGNAGYRGPLYQQLSPLATDFRYIGTSAERPGSLPTQPINQRFHEGHPSYNIQDVSNNLDGFDNARFLQFGGVERNPNGGYWLTGGHGTGRTAVFPDIITLQIGTNDMTIFPGVEGRLQGLISKITTLRPDAKLLVAKITPIPSLTTDEAYNVIVADQVADFQAAGKNVSLVDLHTGFPVNGLDPDGTHPNNIGFDWMAGRWLEGLVAAYSPPGIARPFRIDAAAVPGRIEAEDYDRGGAGISYQDLSGHNEGGGYRPDEGVDIRSTTDAGGGYEVFHSQTGEWLNYTINVAVTGNYVPSLRISNPTVGGGIRLEVDGIDVTNDFAIPDDGGGGSWMTLTLPEIRLDAGEHKLRVVISNTAPGDTAGAINWLEFQAPIQAGPVAVAGPDLEVTDLDGNGTEPVLLSAGASVAGDAAIVSHTWWRGGIQIASGANPTVNLPLGTQVIQLKVTDSAQKQSTDEFIVTVSPKKLLNGSFESGFTDWTVTGNVHVQNTGTFLPTDGGRLAAFNTGNFAPNATMAQSFATTVGGSYTLTFDAGVLSFNTETQTLRVSATGAGGLIDASIVISGNGGGNHRWLPQSFTFIANSPITTITFRDQSLVTLGIDLLLDNINLSGPSPVPVNGAPVAASESHSTSENGVLIVPAAGLLANDVDPDGNPLVAVANTRPAHGTLSLNLDGSFSYIPHPGYFGSDWFSYHASDGFLNSNPVAVRVVVNEVIPPPVAAAESYSTDENLALEVPAAGVLANDSDPRSRPLTAVLDTGPSHGTLILNQNGSFIYTPATAYFGVDSFTYHSRNGHVDSNIVTVSLTIHEAIPRPIAGPDSYTASESIALVVPAPGVLANDVDLRARPLTAIVDTPPVHGSLVLNPNGGFTYTPDFDYYGPDSFTYRANNGYRDSETVRVDLVVNEVIPPPVAVDDFFVTTENSMLAVVAHGLLENDSDPRSRPILAALVAGPSHGTLELSSNGNFTYTPHPGFFGNDSFSYSLSNGFLDSNAATVEILVNEVIPPPVAAADSYQTNEDVPLIVPAKGVLANDSDPRARPLTSVLETGPAHGSLALNADGSFSYVPATDYFGSDSFTYHARNGHLDSGSVTVSLTIHEVIPPPVVLADSYTTLENVPLVIPASGVLANDSDLRGRPLTAVPDTGPAHGLLTLNADGSFIYSPNAGYFGSDSFTYHARNGSVDSGIVTVGLTIQEVVPPPAAADDFYQTDESAALVVEASGILANDSDPRSRPILAALVAAPLHGGLVLNAAGDFIYAPDPGYFGNDSFTYAAHNGFLNSPTATVRITVNEVIPAPVAIEDSYQTLENVPLAVAPAGILANDSDPRGRPLTAVLDSGPTHGVLSLAADGGFDYTPDNNYYGPDSFTYHASNGTVDSGIATVNLTAIEVVRPPTGVADSYQTNENVPLSVSASGVLANDSDPRSRPLFAVMDSSTAHGALTLSATGSFIYTPAAGYFGTDSFSYRATNGSMISDVVTVNIVVNEVIPAPVALADSYQTHENIPLIVPASGVLANDSDLRARPLTAILDAGPSHGSLTLDSNGAFIYTPATNYFGSDSFTYHARNGSVNSGVVTVNLTITEIIPAPLAVAESYQTHENVALVVPSAGVLANDSDLRSRPLTAVLDVGPAHGSLALKADGGFSYIPAANYFGSDSFTYHARNGSVDSGMVTVNLTITEVIPAPLAAADSYQTYENVALVVPAAGVLANDSDLRSRPLTAVLDAGPAHGSLTLNANGAFSYVPAANYFGSDSFTYHARNGNVDSGVVTVSLTIIEVIPAPSAAADSYQTHENVPLVVPAKGILTNDSDPRARPLTAVLDSGPAHGSLALNANGGFSYTPAVNYFGTDSFTYHARNGSVNSGVVTVSITIIEVIPPPAAVADFYQTSENVPLAVPAGGVLANDSDPRARPLTAVLDSGPSHGMLTLNANGSFTYTPAYSYFGSDTFTYHARNGSVNSGTVTVNLTVTEVIPPPAASADVYSTTKGTALVIPAAGVLSNDSDPRSRPLTALLNSGPASGTLSLNANGGFTYNPAAGYAGTVSFTYRARNGVLDSNIATVFIHVNPPVFTGLINGSFESDLTGWTATGNQNIQSVAPYVPTHGSRLIGFNGGNTTPNAVLAQTFNTVVGHTYTLTFDLGVLYFNLNTQTALVTVTGEGSLLSRTITVSGTTGSSSRWYPQSFTFTANSTSSTLTLRDQSSATLNLDMTLDNVKVTGPQVTANTAPLSAPDSYSGYQSGSIVVPAGGVLANDTDAQSNPLTAILNIGPSHGTVLLDTNGSFTYTPAPGYAGSDSFTYHTNDGSLDSNVTVVNLTVIPVVVVGLVNGSFESGYTGWTAIGNQAVQSSAIYTATHGSRIVGFNGGDLPSSGVLSQTFATTSGQSCSLAFDAGVFAFNSNPQTLQVTITGNSNLLTRTITLSGNGAGSTVWTPHAFTFTPDGPSTTLTFRDLSLATSQIDLLLDNVRVGAEGAVSPPPSAGEEDPPEPPGTTPTTPGPPSLSGTPGNLSIATVANEAGFYLLERSTDLLHWEFVSEKQASAPGPLVFQDTTESISPMPPKPRLFYRIGHRR